MLYFWFLNIFKEPFSTFQMEGKGAKGKEVQQIASVLYANVEVQFSVCEWKWSHSRAHRFLLIFFSPLFFLFPFLCASSI